MSYPFYWNQNLNRLYAYRDYVDDLKRQTSYVNDSKEYSTAALGAWGGETIATVPQNEKWILYAIGYDSNNTHEITLRQSDSTIKYIITGITSKGTDWLNNWVAVPNDYVQINVNAAGGQIDGSIAFHRYDLINIYGDEFRE